MRFVKKNIYIKLISNTNNNSKSNSNKMFKSKSYNVEKASKKNEKEKPSSSASTSASTSTGTMTLKKKDKIKSANNKESPEYRQKIYPKKPVTTWKKNETFSPKNEISKKVIPAPKQKLERK